MDSDTTLISVVVPVYGCNICLRELCTRLDTVFQTMAAQYEIILVNDASPDGSWETIVQLSSENPSIKGIHLSRNFGQHHAITAGLDYATGDWTVVMDCDLQDQPEEIPNLYQKACEGYDVVFGKRVVRQDKWLKRLSSKIFYKIYDFLADQSSDHTVANFSICSKKVVQGFQQMREQNRYFPLFIKWMGFETAYIPIEHEERKAGTSSYSFGKLITLATDAIISQSNKPLRLSIQFGFLLSFISLLYGIYLFIRYFFLSEPVTGWTSVMVSIYFIGGLVFFNFGVIGLYLGKVFNETKGRPLYIIESKTENLEQGDWRKNNGKNNPPNTMG
ncbi:glycosyltransferase family 2 protein [Ornithinibacillus gellani]|uniref:glycosyltransferase family 2 protein n=1 Tax=Ornithinibacillus gellani TaxID=2293253 RepID=UPI000F4AE794|nr:glycosyltransferase family 2 protein [Ornithinibacillus gellani]TQS70584.1 glycosyltransferase family 2 protein [Ornithinibacillus gellani]